MTYNKHSRLLPRFEDITRDRAILTLLKFLFTYGVLALTSKFFFFIAHPNKLEELLEKLSKNLHAEQKNAIQQAVHNLRQPHLPAQQQQNIDPGFLEQLLQQNPNPLLRQFNGHNGALHPDGHHNAAELGDPLQRILRPLL